jgi:hypothetical protein
MLAFGKHQNRHLQAAWSKYGVEAFSFELIEEVTPDLLTSREQAHLDAGGLLYNTCMVAGVPPSHLGVKRRTRRIVSAETRAKLSATTRGRPGKSHTAETRAKLADAARRQIHTPESKANQSVAMKGRAGTSPSIETRAKIAAANIGKTLSPEIRAQISAALNTPEARAKRRAAQVAAFARADVKAKLRESAKRRWAAIPIEARGRGWPSGARADETGAS